MPISPKLGVGNSIFGETWSELMPELYQVPQLCRVTDIFTRVFIYFSMSKNAEETNNMLDRWAKVFDKRFVNISQSQRGSIIVVWSRVLWMMSIYATHAQNIYKNTTIVTKISLTFFMPLHYASLDTPCDTSCITSVIYALKCTKYR